MSPPRRYPDEPADAFDPPPTTFADGAGRPVALHAFGDGPLAERGERASLFEMYADFDPADRAQGVPPAAADALESWLDGLLREDRVNVLAWHGESVVGHATLVPDADDSYELAIFVHQDYRRAGIGSRLIRALLGAGARAGVERVWLSVERWNRPAIGLYEDVGFETTSAASFELEMALRLGG